MKLKREVIDKELEKLGIPQAELARRVGVSRHSLNQYLQKEYNVPRKVAYKIADTLGLDFYEIIEFGTGYF